MRMIQSMYQYPHFSVMDSHIFRILIHNFTANKKRPSMGTSMHFFSYLVPYLLQFAHKFKFLCEIFDFICPIFEYVSEFCSRAVFKASYLFHTCSNWDNVTSYSASNLINGLLGNRGLHESATIVLNKIIPIYCRTSKKVSTVSSNSTYYCQHPSILIQPPPSAQQKKHETERNLLLGGMVQNMTVWCSRLNQLYLYMQWIKFVSSIQLSTYVLNLLAYESFKTAYIIWEARKQIRAYN